MTVSIERQSPTPGQENVSGRPVVFFGLASDDPLAPVILSTVNVYFGSDLVVENGIVVEGWDVTITQNAQYGWDFAMRRDLPPETWVPMKAEVAALVFEWKFLTADAWGPRAVDAVPAQFSDGAVVSPTITFTLLDDSPNRNTALRILESTASDGVVTGSFLQSDDTIFTGREGRYIEVNGSPFEIVAVNGPNYCMLDSPPGDTTGATVDLYQDRGLDVYVDGERVIKVGVGQVAANWTGSLVDNTTSIDVTVNRTGPALTAGDRVRVSVLAPNDDQSLANVSNLGWHFDIGDTLAPTIANLNPPAASRGLDTSTAQQVYFEIDDTVAPGVDSATLNVWVDGVAAITAGAGVGDFSGSTVVSDASNGYDVTLIKGTSWTDGDHVFIEVAVDDTAGNSARRVWGLHFGTGAGSLAMDTGAGNLPADDVSSVQAFDLSHTSFARPEELRHNGYAYDGRLYAEGYPVEDSPASGPAVSNLASWYTEAAGATRGSIAQFPVSGYLVTMGGYWAILDNQAQLWMSCEALATADPTEWSMAGNSLVPLSDCDVGDDGTLFIAGESVILVDFVGDQATRYSTIGKTVGTSDIAGRAGNQKGNTSDNTYALTYQQIDRVAGLAWQDTGVRSQVFVACRQVKAEFVNELAGTWVQAQGEDPTALSRVSEIQRTANSWTGARMAQSGYSCALGYNIASLAHVNTVNWLEQFKSGGSISIYNQSSTPALPGEEARDLDMVRDDSKWIWALATDTGVHLLNVLTDALVTRSDVDLTLNIGGTNPRITAVALEPGFRWGLGHLYAAAREDTPSGKVVRWREQAPSATTTGQVVTIGTDEVDSLSAIGNSRLDAVRSVRASLNIATEDVWSVRASLEAA